MALSGTYTFTVNRDEVIRNAMLSIGALYEGEVPSSSEISDMSNFLNMMVKQWQARQDFAPGLKMWNRLRGELYLSSTTGQYSLGSSAAGWGTTHNQTTLAASALAGAGTVTLTSATGFTSGDNVGICLSSGALFWTTATLSGVTLTLASNLPSAASAGAYVFNYATTQIRPEIIETAVLRDVNYNDIPLNMMTLQDYEFLPTKTAVTNVMNPQAIYYEYGVNSSNAGTLYTDAGAAADTTRHIHMVFLSPAMDIAGSTDNFCFPQSWYLPLSLNLGKLAAQMFNKPWTPLHQENAASALAMAQEAYSEVTSLYFEPNRDDRMRG